VDVVAVMKRKFFFLTENSKGGPCCASFIKPRKQQMNTDVQQKVLKKKHFQTICTSEEN
jgi:hypothetical protein